MCESSRKSIESERIGFSGLLKITWKVFHTTLLIDPSHESLRNKTVNTTRAIMNNIQSDNKSLKVAFTRCPAITFFESTPPALLVEVENNNELIYIGYFITSTFQAAVENFEALPIHLVKAKANIAKIVHKALMEVFDFVLFPLELSSRQLSLFLAAFIRFAKKEDEGTACLQFNIPGLPRTDHISASVRVKDLKVVFDFFNEADDATDPISEVFYEKLLNHFKRYYELDLSRADFTKISVPDGSFTYNGAMRVKNSDVLYACLMAIDSVMPKQIPAPPPSSFPDSDA